MRKLLSIISVVLMICACPVFADEAASGLEERETVTFAPFVEYQYRPDMEAASDVLESIKVTISGYNPIFLEFLPDYDDFELFKHIVLAGTEIHVPVPAIRPATLFFSLAGAAGSTHMLGEDYHDTYEPDIPFVDVTVDTRIGQYMDYYLPLQAGLRFDSMRPDRRLSFFGSLSAGMVLFQGRLDVDIDFAAASVIPDLAGHMRFDGKAVLEDVGWTATMLTGVRMAWMEGAFSSLAIGYGVGDVHNAMRINGTVTGSEGLMNMVRASGMPDRYSYTRATTLRLDSFRLRLTLFEFNW
jgi:hypothetical protein